MNLDHANAPLFAALALAQGEIENATKNSVNGGFSKNGKPSYADLAEVLNTVRPTFAKHGLAIVQSTSAEPGVVYVTTAIVHKDGGYVTSTASCVPAKADAQGIGAATTYLRRYGLAAMAGVAQEDDDGNSAAHNKPVAQRRSSGLPLLLTAITDAGTDEQLELLREQIRTLVGTDRAAAIDAFTNRKAALTAKESNE
jgi:hypothetical protein